MAGADLSRFVEAQDGGEYETALAEMRAGRKVSHWIWYVFPQLAGLGSSSMSRTYAIRDRAEAEAYLRDPLLSARLFEVTHAAGEQLAAGVPVATLMGSAIDAAKLASSMTLFERVARELDPPADSPLAAFAARARQILTTIEPQGHPACRHTLRALADGV